MTTKTKYEIIEEIMDTLLKLRDMKTSNKEYEEKYLHEWQEIIIDLSVSSEFEGIKELESKYIQIDVYDACRVLRRICYFAYNGVEF
jgi:predicted RNA-binding protein with EMAP domain